MRHRHSVLSEDEHRHIAEAIKTAETQTSGEIYCVLARNSDSYFYPSSFMVTLAMLIAGFVLATILQALWIAPRLPLFLFAEILAIACGLLVLSVRPAWRIHFVPRRLRYQRAHEEAIKQFMARNVHATVGRTGVLLFVSLAERYAEVVADAAIDSKVEQKDWNGIVAELTAHASRAALAQGFVLAIQLSGALLASHFPPESVNPNELDDHLVEL